MSRTLNQHYAGSSAACGNDHCDFPPSVLCDKGLQTANLRGFHPSVNPRFEDRIPDLIKGIPDFMEIFKTV